MTGKSQAGERWVEGVTVEAFDLLFVGAGVAAAYTLLTLLWAIDRTSLAQPLRIGVIERSGELYVGLPYGHRSSHSSLLITSLQDFLPRTEREPFADWLSHNKAWAFDRFRLEGGDLSAKWWSENQRAVDGDRWDGLYLPRYLFGMYMNERVNREIDRQRAAGRASVQVMQHEVTNIERRNSSYTVTTASAERYRAETVVLAIGTAPQRPALAQATSAIGEAGRSGETDEDAAVCVVDNLYDPGLDHHLDRIRRFAERSGRDRLDVLIIGGNASAIEALYLLNDLDLAPIRRGCFVVVTPAGSLPERLVAPDPVASFVPDELERLRGVDDVSAETVYQAARRDIDRGRALGLTISDTLRPISSAVGTLVRSLPDAEQREFAEHWGVQLGRFQRRAGTEYSDAVAALTAEGRLELVAGRFRRIIDGGSEGARFELERNGSVEQFPRPVDVVIDCSGGAGLGQLPPGSLLERLLQSGTCTATRSGSGLQVNDDMEANDGLYVMGPLLAGNLVDGVPVWHMEHCGRVSSFSAVLGETLARRLAGVGQTQTAPIGAAHVVSSARAIEEQLSDGA